ncbi:MAG TPA: hypothetical protein VI408_00270 [Gaiellaceae bacterium]
MPGRATRSRRLLFAALAAGCTALALETVGAPAKSQPSGEGRAGGCTRVWTIDKRLPRTDLNAVAADARGTWAVGTVDGKGIALRLSGGRWSSTRIAGVRELTGVARGTNEIWAVGNRFSGEYSARGIIARQTGDGWRLLALHPAPLTTRGFVLSAVAVRDGDVWIVGSYDNTQGNNGPDDDGWLVARRHASRWQTWRGGFSDSLAAVSVVASDNVWAVGRTGVNIASEDEVAVHWDGSRWSYAMRSRAQDVRALNDVLALSRDDVWAVGEPRTEDVPSPAPVVEHWDGRRWTRVALAASLWPAIPRLTALAAFRRDDVWAGGDVNGRPALLHWNGSAWLRATPPPIAAPLADLAAARDGTLWAVGPGFVAHSACRTT